MRPQTGVLTDSQKKQAKEGMVAISLYLPPELLTKLKRLAVKEATPVTILARRAVLKEYREEFEAMEAKDEQAASA